MPFNMFSFKSSTRINIDIYTQTHSSQKMDKRQQLKKLRSISFEIPSEFPLCQKNTFNLLEFKLFNKKKTITKTEILFKCILVHINYSKFVALVQHKNERVLFSILESIEINLSQLELLLLQTVDCFLRLSRYNFSDRMI